MATIGIISGIFAVLVSLAALATFIINMFKEAIAKGRLYEKIDNIRKDVDINTLDVKNIDTKINCHDGDIIRATSDIGNTNTTLARMEKKIDSLVGAQEC